MDKIALNVTEVSEALGVSRPVVYQLMRRADFPSFTVGKRRLVPKDALVDWVNGQVQKENQSDIIASQINYGGR